MMNVADIEKLTDHEIASHASGAFGPKKRIEFIALVRRLAAGAQVKVDREVEPPSVA
jgi:ribosomal protein L32E